MKIENLIMWTDLSDAEIKAHAVRARARRDAAIQRLFVIQRAQQKTKNQKTKKPE